MKALVLEDTLKEYKNIEGILTEKNIQIEHYKKTEDVITAIGSGKKFDLYIIDYILEGSEHGDKAITKILTHHKDAKIVLNSSFESAQGIADKLGVLYSDKKPESLKAKIDALLGLKTYEGVNVETAILEYSLDFLHYCMMPETINEAQTSLDKLKKVASEMNLENNQYELLNNAYSKFTALKEIATKEDPFSKAYISALSSIRDDLLSVATNPKKANE